MPATAPSVRPRRHAPPQAAPAARHASPPQAFRDPAAATRYAPLVWFQAYLTATLLAFAFGPLDAHADHPALLYGYALAGQGAIALGYFAGAAIRPRGCRSGPRAGSLVRWSTLLTLLLLPATIAARLLGGMSIVEALTNPGDAYAARIDAFEGGESAAPALFAARVLASPLLRLFFPLGVVWWDRMPASMRFAWLAGALGLTIEAMISGAAVGLFDLVLVTPWMLWLRERRRAVAAARPPSERGLAGWRRAPSARAGGRVVPVAAAALVLVLGLRYFQQTRQARYGLEGDEYPSHTIGWSEELYGFGLPASVEYPAYLLAQYTAQGYEGLGECLELPFVWSGGAGHSSFLTRCVGKLGADRDAIVASIYPVRLELDSGYSAIHRWHTIYPWLASDLTFPGAIVFVGMMGFLLARAWNDALLAESPLAVGALAQLLMLFYYIPANAGRISYAEESMAFWGLLAAWLATSRGAGRGAALARAPSPAARALRKEQ